MREAAFANELGQRRADRARRRGRCYSWWLAGHGRARGSSGAGAGGGGFWGAGGAGGGGPPFPPFPGFPWNLFRRARAKRGDVRAAILSLLAEKPLNGYQIMQELEQRSRGTWRPSPGAVYPALQLLEDEGFVRVESTTGGRVYSLTDAGRTHVKEHADELGAPWEAAQPSPHDECVFGLFGELKHIAAASLQVVHNGTSAQMRDAQKILQQARRALYHLLAEDGADDTDE
jgi:DNA-binding PadR family transcriptional regulator